MTTEKKPGIVDKIRAMLFATLFVIAGAVIASIMVVWMFDCLRAELFLIQNLGWSPTSCDL